jgi:hypothetical protein
MFAAGTDRTGIASAPNSPGRRQFTLTPLRTHGLQSLAIGNIPGLLKVALCELHISWCDLDQTTVIQSAHDLSHCCTPLSDLPESGLLTYATFEFHFAGREHPTLVNIAIADGITVSVPGDLDAGLQWFDANGFTEPCSRSGDIALAPARTTETPEPVPHFSI